MTGQFHVDPHFDARLRHALHDVRAVGIDVAWMMSIASRIPAGDLEAWQATWRAAADRVMTEGDGRLWADDLTGAARCFLRAAAYYREAGMFAQRCTEARSALRTAGVNAFRAALPLLPVSARIVAARARGTETDGYWFAPDTARNQPSVVVVLAGQDTSPEACYQEIVADLLALSLPCLVVGLGPTDAVRAADRDDPEAEVAKALAAATSWLAERVGDRERSLVGVSWPADVVPEGWVTAAGDRRFVRWLRPADSKELVIQLGRLARPEPLTARPVPFELHRR